MHKRRRRPDHRSYLFTLEKVLTHKTMPSQAIVRHNQLRPDLGFSPCKSELWISPMLPPPLSNDAAPSHGSLCQNFNATRNQTTIASLHSSTSMSFSATNFTMGLKPCPMMATDCKASHRSLWNQTVKKNMVACDQIQSDPANSRHVVHQSSPAEPSRTRHSS
jgi:hypothetical protein